MIYMFLCIFIMLILCAVGYLIGCMIYDIGIRKTNLFIKIIGILILLISTSAFIIAILNIFNIIFGRMVL